jgi:hypothetical protein
MCLVQGGHLLCDFNKYDYGPKSYWPESKDKKGKEVEVELVAPDRNCRCGIVGNYGLVPSELGIGYYCGHMIGDDMVGFLVILNPLKALCRLVTNLLMWIGK